ncbi:MFS transporter [Marixanthomonas spongiae]|uniref:MFS transporter n=1 Tax=Marixanthomonas spongiae TaxID=2174845 RepID=A0A2U0I0Y6_9FLAO|nr:MFS transporter [Marixanthomonas spongiae]PVW14773.1 MFS transporter [Marixanthomonas spongiae]
MRTSTKKIWASKFKIFYMFLLILSGEAVFVLPFVLARVFRATVLDVFHINNTELGFCFSIYGIVAVFSYLFGGPLADRFQPRKLMGTALILTALGGLVYAGSPSLITLAILYGFWGFTTIFLFWSAMIKATRVWGGHKNQGKAFGFLDGGRGLVGALFGLLGVLVFSFFVTDTQIELKPTEQAKAFQSVIYVSSAIVALIGVVVFFFLKIADNDKMQTLDKITFENIKTVLRLPVVWLLMLIILCAYVGYKITDIISLYAKNVMHYSEVDAAQTGTFLLFIRPVVGVAIGFLADRSKGSIYLCLGFLLSIVGALLFASGILKENMDVLFFISITITAVGVYAARVLYFAVLEEGRIPLLLTGTAVGIISFIGYTPEVFAGPAIGYFLDATPGMEGHQHVFWMLAVFSVIGFLASYIFYRITNR